MPEFDSGGVRLRYALAGPDDGPPIVLVHGYCSDYELNWVGSRWQETLTRDGRLVLGLDCRGHGRSEKPHDPAAYDRSTMAADVVRLLDHLDIADADYLGYSMGARIGLDAIIEHADRFGRAILGGLGNWGGGARSDVIARRMRGDESVDDPAAEMFYRFAASRQINDLEALACCILGPQRALTGAELASISVPVAIMVGERDPIARGGPELAAQIPGARFVSITGRDHMNAVPARQFKDAALEFLAERRFQRSGRPVR
jgi:pimeloyl-ACP methyl ester carboxylesterase